MSTAVAAFDPETELLKAADGRAGPELSMVIPAMNERIAILEFIETFGPK